VALTWIGVAVGLAGVAVLVRPGGSESVGGSDTATRTLWSLAIVGGTMCWALGSFLAPRIPTPRNPFVLSTYEMLIGGAFLVLLGLLRGERLDAAAVSHSAASGWVAFGYLFLIGSVLAFTCYVWVLDHAPLSLVMTYAYVNPVVAVALGALLLHEPLTPSIVVGGAIVVVGVLLVVTAERLRPPTPADSVPEPDAH
jgi:drug/metabolite transporter (DMT)-like permease